MGPTATRRGAANKKEGSVTAGQDNWKGGREGSSFGEKNSHRDRATPLFRGLSADGSADRLGLDYEFQIPSRKWVSPLDRPYPCFPKKYSSYTVTIISRPTEIWMESRQQLI